MCFANPGTSEMHFVAALDSAPQMRAVLCPFEGVATGAADGYARIAGRPAATLLHLGPGMANGLANLHNARRAHSPVVNVVGDHATYHQKLDAPLQSDIDALGNWLNGTVHRPASGAELGAAVDAAVASATLSRHIATLILPADLSWSESESDGAATACHCHTRAWRSQAPLEGNTNREIAEKLPFAQDVEGHLYRDYQNSGRAKGCRTALTRCVDAAGAAKILKSHGEHTVLLLGGPATTAAGLRAAARISAATGAKALVETFPARLARGQRRARYPTPGLLRRTGAGTAQGDNAFVVGRSAVAGHVLRVSQHGE